MAEAGMQVTVLTTDPSGQLPAAVRMENVDIRRVRAWPAKRDYYWAPDLLHWIVPGDWDIVHVQSYHTLVAPLAMWAALRAGCPYLVTFHGGGHSSRLRHLLRGVQLALLRPLLARAQCLIATAKFEIPLFVKALRLPSDRFAYIPNGCDLPKLSLPTLTHPGSDLLISIGRLERYKGHQHVIAALPHVLRQRPEVRLLIAGSGPYEAELRRMAERLGVANRVEIRAIPASDRIEMATCLSQAALVLLLSEYETHPMAILEALALGRPVLVSDTSGLKELAQRHYVRAIPVHSSAIEVAEAILDQLNQPSVSPQLDLPTWDDCTADLMQLYGTIVRSQACAS
jgi:glycosyltransferase involved in cell wall biosynthesis